MLLWWLPISDKKTGSIMNLLLVAIGGFFGSVIRFYISEQTSHKFVATWLANITGSILLAFMLHLYLSSVISTQVWLVFGVGFCGAYTTFSTLGNETLQFILDKKYKLAIGYLIASIGVSLFFVMMILYFLK